MEVTVHLFAMARDLAGTPTAALSLPPGATASALLDELVRRFPRLAEWKPYLRVAVNCSYAQADQPVAQADDIAIIPPVSGG